MARNTKILRLPSAIREELNERRYEGAKTTDLLRWLNSLPETRKVLEEEFHGVPIGPGNLRSWRRTHYPEWLERRERGQARLARIRELSAMSLRLARASGGNLSEGAASVLGGSILELLEQIDAAREKIAANTATPESLAAASEALTGLAASVARLRRGDHDRELLRQNRRRLAQKDKDLALAQAAFEQKLKEYEEKVAARKREIEEAVTGAQRGGLTPEALKRIQEAARLL